MDVAKASQLKVALCSSHHHHSPRPQLEAIGGPLRRNSYATNYEKILLNPLVKADDEGGGGGGGGEMNEDDNYLHVSLESDGSYSDHHQYHRRAESQSSS